MTARATPVDLSRRRASHLRRLPHRCDIYRAAITGTNTRGETEYGAPTLVESLRCHLVIRTIRGEQFTPERNTVAHEWQLHLPADTDVRESDEIRNVRDQNGAVIATGPLDINAVLTHPTITVAVLERIN